MPMQERSYEQVRDQVQPGDVVAFGGDNVLSETIMKSGNSTASHAGIIVAKASRGQEPRFIEATIRVEGNDPTQVAEVTSFRDRLEEYHGQAWWLPLHPTVRGTFREDEFMDFIHGVEGKFFDLTEGVAVVLKNLLRLPDPPVAVRTGDFLFCSELVVDALRAGGVVGRVDPSKVSPAALCRWSIYGDVYTLLRGTQGTTIPGYNTLPPGTT